MKHALPVLLVTILAACGGSPAPPPIPALPQDFGLLDPVIQRLLESRRAGVEASPQDVEARVGLGMALEANGLHTEALSAYEGALQLAPERHLVRFHYGICLRESGDIERAQAEVATASRALPTVPAVQFLHGLDLLDAGEWDPAEAAFRSVREAMPGLPHGFYGLGRVALGKGQANKARPYLEKAVSLAPGEKALLFALGQAYAALGRESEAKSYLTRGAGARAIYLADPMTPSLDADARGKLAILDRCASLRTTGELDTAISLLTELRSRYPEDETVVNFLAGTLIDAGELKGAAKILDSALAQHPDWASAHINQSILLQRSGDMEGALAAAAKAVKMAPKVPGMRLQYGEVLMAMERLPEAYVQFQRVAEFGSDSADIQNRLAQLCLLQGLYGDGVAHMGRSIDVNPTDPTIHLNLIRTLVRLQRRDTAEAAFAAMKKALPGHPALQDADDMIAELQVR